MARRIGILTGGGDCPGLNAAIRGVVKSAAGLGWDVLGIRRGFEGLLPPQDVRPLTLESTADILTLGGTILGAASGGRFAAKTGHGEAGRLPADLGDKSQDLGFIHLDDVRGLEIVGDDDHRILYVVQALLRHAHEVQQDLVFDVLDIVFPFPEILVLGFV